MKLHELFEASMPASVIKDKQKLSYMKPTEMKAYFDERANRLNKSLETVARELAWRHGYGQMSNKYWNQIKDL